jgi:hypothetical protein
MVDMSSGGRFFVVMAFAIGVGCSEPGGSSTDWVPDDLTSGQTLDDIGDAGYQRLCSAFDDWAHDQYRSSYLIQAVCTAQGIEHTDTASACGDYVQTCIDSPPAEAEAQLDQILGQAGCAAVSAEPTGCAATVGQVQDCLDGLGAEVEAIQFTLTCAAAGQVLDPGWWMITPPAICGEISSLC